jgi:hypothetical protein
MAIVRKQILGGDEGHQDEAISRHGVYCVEDSTPYHMCTFETRTVE